MRFFFFSFIYAATSKVKVDFHKHKLENKQRKYGYTFFLKHASLSI
jgi:hypothetical protein